MLDLQPPRHTSTLREVATRRLGFDRRGPTSRRDKGRAVRARSPRRAAPVRRGISLIARETFRSRSVSPQPMSAAAKSIAAGLAARLAVFRRRYSRCRQAFPQNRASRRTGTNGASQTAQNLKMSIARSRPGVGIAPSVTLVKEPGEANFGFYDHKRTTTSAIRLVPAPRENRANILKFHRP